MLWYWQPGKRLIKVIGNVSMWKSTYDFVLTFYSNYGSILKCWSQVTDIGVIPIRQSGCGSVLVFGSNFVPNRMTVLGDQNIFQMNLVIWRQ